MIKQLLVIFMLLSSFVCNAQEVTVTVYNPTICQCDSTPTITACNKEIPMNLLKQGTLRWCAVSRDLLKVYSYGDIITLYISENHPYNGRWRIMDTMNKRYSNHIDLLTYNTKIGKWNGKIEYYGKEFPKLLSHGVMLLSDSAREHNLLLTL